MVLLVDRRLVRPPGQRELLDQRERTRVEDVERALGLVGAVVVETPGVPLTRKSSGGKGLAMKSWAPSFMASTAFSMVPKAVMMITGT
jgi:hypothetical protein